MSLMFSRRRADGAKKLRAAKTQAVQKRQAEAMEKHGIKTPFPPHSKVKEQPKPKVEKPLPEGAKKDGSKPDGAK